MENPLIQKKMKILFDKLPEPGYVMNNYYADGLLKKLSSCEQGKPLVESMTLVMDLITDALNKTHDAHPTVKVFLIRILATVSSSELNFAKIFSKNRDDIVQGFGGVNSELVSPSLRVAYMELALAIVQHNSGIAWLLETGVWKDILNMPTNKHTVFVVRQTYKFVSMFLWKLNDRNDEAQLREIIQTYFLKPLDEINLINYESITSENEKQLIKTFEPMLQILLSTVNNKDRIRKSTLLMTLLLKDYKMTSHMYIIFDRLRREDMINLVTRLLFWMVVAKIFLLKPLEPGTVYAKEDFLDLEVLYFNVMQALIARRNAVLVLDFCNSCNLAWSSMMKDVTFVQDSKIVKLQNQLLFICIVPCLVYVQTVGNFSDMTYERIVEYIEKLLNNTCEHTAKAAYALRDLTLELDTLTVTLQSVKRLTSLSQHLNTEQANIVFKALFYILKEYEPHDENGQMKEEENYEYCENKVLVMSYVLDVVLCLVTNHNINWQESFEVLCLYTVMYNILERRNLSCKFVVTALNLITVTIRKFIPPNLSLLMESKPGTAIHELGPLIYRKMHDRHWEIRDSALELLLQCTELSLIKFPPFQNQIIENRLINVAAALALHESEYYVQVSALKCVGAASKIPSLWEQLCAEYPDVQDQLISILRNSQEGIVRKEASNVLCELYQNRKETQTTKQVIYDHMVSSALSDFHWEVQLSALKFWKVVISALLSDQGMLDGTFPPKTFSRETRKIVTLNQTEIQRRLHKTLDELASIGCLTVLVRLLHDDTEIEIMECALNIATDLINILNKYNAPDNIKPSDNEPKSLDELITDMEEERDFNNYEMAEPTDTSADNVIESILNANDINLLSNIYNKHMNLQNEKEESPITPKMKIKKYATPYFFVNFLRSKDFKAVIDEKRKWNDGIRSISSLLDDVLGIYDINEDINTLDCY